MQKNRRKKLTAWQILPLLWFLVFCLAAIPAPQPPDANQSNQLAETAELTVAAFMQESFHLRMRCQFNGRFLSRENEEKFRKLAERTKVHLEAIAGRQQRLKEQIEQYQGRDWENKYGSTGLWRRLAGQLYFTRLNKYRADLYLAVTCEQPQRNRILNKILTQTENLNNTHSTKLSRLLHCKILAALAEDEPAFESEAVSRLDSLINETEHSDEVHFRAIIEKLGLSRKIQPSQLNEPVAMLEQSQYPADFESVFSLSGLAYKFRCTDQIKKIIEIRPQIQDLTGLFILEQLAYSLENDKSAEDTAAKISLFEAELAAYAALRNNPEDYGKILQKLTNTNESMPLFYAAALAVKQTHPEKTVDLLISSSRIPKHAANKNFNLSADQIAAQAGKLAYWLFENNELSCTETLKALENYSAIAQANITEQMEYIYSKVLYDCNRFEESSSLLKKIVGRPEGKWQKQAELDLIIRTAQKNPPPEQRRKLLRKIRQLIDSCDTGNQTTSGIRLKALNLYCRLLFEDENRRCAEQITEILTPTDTDADKQLCVFKSRALRILGRPAEAADLLLQVADSTNCEFSAEAMSLLEQIIDQLDRLEFCNPDFRTMITDCQKLAQICYDCLDGKQKLQAGLYLAEAAIFAGAADKQLFEKIDELLDEITARTNSEDINLLRCRARLNCKFENFEKAALLWAGISKTRKALSRSDYIYSRYWWRARFYELKCWSKCPQIRKSDIIHTIDVLQNSSYTVPQFWAEKLFALKNSLAGNIEKR